MCKAAFAGSFDPPTFGHFDIIKRAAALFGNLVVIVAHNAEKACLFSAEERQFMLSSFIKAQSNINVIICPAGTMLVDCLKKNDVNTLVRGVRNGFDFTYELETARVNEIFFSGLETIFLPSRPELTAVRSSAVRELAAYNADISQFVPKEVAAAIQKKLTGKSYENYI